jgi:hypothetical protein
MPSKPVASRCVASIDHALVNLADRGERHDGRGHRQGDRDGFAYLRGGRGINNGVLALYRR